MGISVEVKNVYKSFGNKQVLQGVNLKIEPSESFVILGGSGCGKSVLLKHIAKLVRPDKGQILLNNINIQGIKQDAYPISKIGILFQEIGLFDFMNVWENVAFHYTEVLGYNKKDAQKLALKHLEDVGITELSAYIKPSSASLGMQKRIGLARVLVGNPELILLDEPTSGLDTISSQKISNVSLKQIKKMKATSITVTHNLKLAKYVGDRIGLMHQGKFEWIGTPDEFEKTNNHIVHNFIEGIGEDTAKQKLEKKV
ncbi:MAG: ATP-binding cassette domain-containing protein [Alphaproteobacteria bacterium]|nr:ATP-binding cassette domain-containing protein [Rickettsiales bacterium]